MSDSLAVDCVEDAQANEIAPSPEEAHTELERLLADARFSATSRRKAMLKFIVDETLAGREDSIKGVSIAQAVFGRGVDFDQQSDSIVRIEARRLRHDLDLYYLGPGSDNPLRISVPKGRYVPHFARVKNDQWLPEPTRYGHYFRQKSRVWFGAALATLLIIGTITATTAYMRAESDDSRIDYGPSITVLPFEPTSDTEIVHQLSRGLNYELIAGLKRFPHFRLFTPARSADVGNSIVTDYVISGTIGLSTDTVHLVAKLTHRATGEVVWGQDYNDEISTRTLLDIQRDVASRIASTVAPNDGVLQKRLAAYEVSEQFEPSLPAYKCVLQAYEFRRSASMGQFEPAKACLLDAVKNEPNYAEAWALLAWLRFDEYRFRLGHKEDRSQALTLASAAASTSLALEPENVQAIRALAAIHYNRKKFDESWRLLRKALEINPNDPNTAFQLGWRLALRGHLEEGIVLVEEAIARSVRPRSGYYRMLAVNHLLSGEFEEMLAAAARSNAPRNGKSLALMAIAHGKIGNEVAARQALAEMEAVDPNFARDPETYYLSHHPTEEIYDAVVDGFKGAGWTPPSTVVSASET